MSLLQVVAQLGTFMHSRLVRALVAFAVALFAACSAPRYPGQPGDGIDAGWSADADSAADAGPDAADVPRIAITPLRLDFDSNTPASPRRFAIANVGTAPLKFGKVDGTGAWIAGAPELAGDAPEAFIMDWPPAGFDEQAGIAPGAVLDVVVHTSVGKGAEASALLRIPSNDPETPAIALALRADPVQVPHIPCAFDVSPPKLSFGTIEPGRERLMSFHIRNLAPNPDAACVLGSVAMEPGSDSSISIPNPPAAGTVIPAASELEFQVRLSASVGGSWKGTIVVQMENAAQAVTVPVGGATRAAGCLMIAPQDVDFSSAQVSCDSREVELTVYNVCPVAQEIDSITLSPADAGFVLTRSVALPRTLDAGREIVLAVTFRPTTIGPTSATLEVGTYSGNRYVATLSGAGYTVPDQTDVFAQGEQAHLDVLLVVDNSVSMASRQQRLVSEVQSLMGFYDYECFDYQIAVTTTEVDAAHGGSGTMAGAANGAFLPLDGSSPRIVTASMPDRYQLIAQRLQLGFTATAPEYLIRPAVLALTPPLSTGENAGFIRPNADLAVLVISDTADHDTAPVAGYAATLQALKPNPNTVSFSAIVPTLGTPPATCSYGEPDAGNSSRVRDIVQATGGVTTELCDAFWLSFLGNGSNCAQLNRTRFWLSNEPSDPHAIQVTVNGINVPEVAATGTANWTYDATGNAVEFTSLALVPPGATILAKYAVGCH